MVNLDIHSIMYNLVSSDSLCDYLAKYGKPYWLLF